MFIKIIFMVIFLVVGVLGCYQVYKGHADITAAQTWPSASGMIVSVTLRKNTGTQKRPTTKTRLLHYRYNVKHTQYEGEREYFGVQMASHTQNAAGYYEDQVVDVYYNPANPSQSVLKPQSYRGIIVPLIISLLFLITSGFLVFMLYS